jgi:hypothetical protein
MIVIGPGGKAASKRRKDNAGANAKTRFETIA